jgi:hypothetical protein
VQGLRTLALGHLVEDEADGQIEAPADIGLSGQPLPTSMSKLTALSSLALHNIGWESAPDGLPSLPQVCCTGYDCRQDGLLVGPPGGVDIMYGHAASYIKYIVCCMW